ncbi:hypothetical protein MBLNU459_g5266t1 [Dothideomycetes sp. NU459]
MASYLEALPVELTERIVTLLELGDVAALRMTSRTVESKASGGSFTDYFKHKNVELTTKSLQNFVRWTTECRLSHLLQHCTIIGIIRTEATATRDAAEHLKSLLAEALRTLKRRCLQGRIASLCLRVAARTESAEGELCEPNDFRNWRAVWSAALCTFNVTMGALSNSQLPVNEHLNIFGSLTGCSLACDVFLAVTKKPALKHVFGSLRRMTLSLSAPPKAAVIHDQTGYEFFARLNIQTESSHAKPILQSISHIMPQLEVLDFHWYTLKGSTFDSSMFHPLPPCQENSVTLATLHFILRGIYVSETDLLHFLEAFRPAAVTLTDIHLISGSYTSVFNHLTDPNSPVTAYTLDDLREECTKLVHFKVPGEAKFPYGCRTEEPSSLTRQANNSKSPIHYHFPSERPFGSAQMSIWCNRKVQRFGPPGRRYDFVRMNSKIPDKGSVVDLSPE